MQSKKDKSNKKKHTLIPDFEANHGFDGGGIG